MKRRCATRPFRTDAPVGGLAAMGVSLAASLTALIWTTPVLQAAIDPARDGGPPSIVAPQPPLLAQATADPPLTPYQGTPPPGYDGVMGAIRDWLARANRDYQGVVIRRLSQPADGAGSDEIARKIEETKSEAARASAVNQKEQPATKAAEVKERAAAEEAQADRTAAEAAKVEAAEAAKAKAADAAAAKPAADQNAADEAVRKATAEAAAEAERQRLANEREIEAQRAAEERRTAEAEARRVAEEQRQTESRLAEERRWTAEAQRSASEAREDRRAIVLTTEPIGRDERSRGWRSAFNEDDRYRVRRYGPRVERWVYRDRVRDSCRRAGRRIVPPGWYRVAAGDSLWRISAKHYRYGRHYRRLLRANRRLMRHPRRIVPCQRIYVPRLSR